MNNFAIIAQIRTDANFVGCFYDVTIVEIAKM